MASSHVADLIERVDKVHRAPYYFLWIDTAWTVMLIKQGLIPRDHVEPVVKAALEAWEDPNRLEPLDPLKISYAGFGALQRYVIEKYGIGVAGNLTLGRTIPPQFQQFPLRHELFKTMCAVYDLRTVLLDLAENHLETVMPGYTHMAHAQPTTFGHYILSIYDPIERIWPRLDTGFSLLSLCELGCGALAGTSWNIDRNMVAEYLGLEGLIENSNDAVAYADGYLHVVASATAASSVISRLAMDFRMWCSREYGFIELPPRKPLAPQSKGGKGRSRSHFMPQKTRGADDHEHASRAVAHSLGALTRVAAMAIRIPQMDCGEMTDFHQGTRDALEALRGTAANYARELPKLIVHKDRMLASVKAGYSCATELANHLVRKYGFDYRTAHHIVNLFVIAQEEQQLPATEPRLELFEAAAQEVTGRKLGVTLEELKTNLDPVHFVKVTDSQGGVAPEETGRMVRVRRARLAEAYQGLEKRLEVLENAQAKLLNDLRSLIS